MRGTAAPIFFFGPAPKQTPCLTAIMLSIVSSCHQICVFAQKNSLVSPIVAGNVPAKLNLSNLDCRNDDVVVMAD